MLSINASPKAAAALAEATRTEDVCMTKDGTRLAVAGFSENKIFIFSIQITRHAESVDIQISDYLAISSSSFQDPHGLTFLGRDHLVVCNREGDVCIFRIPSMEASISEVTLDPIERISGQGFLRAKVKNAGSLVAYELAENIYRIIVCSDQWHFVTAHRITLGETPGIVHEGVLLQNGLKIPDGAAISPDHKWISITNHVHGEVLLFKNTDKLNKQSEPDARLTGLVCPHGVDFDPSGNI